MINCSNILSAVIYCGVLFFTHCCGRTSDSTDIKEFASVSRFIDVDSNSFKKAENLVDTVLYNRLQLHLVHSKPNKKWPVVAPYPLSGAILPFHRIVAFYGNFYSKNMGILGELPTDQVLKKLQLEVHDWQQADTVIPVLPAIHYIAVTAQKNPGKDHKYRLRMPFHQIDKALEMAHAVNGVLILDVQIGHCSLEEELPALEVYLKRPEVHLAIDPEYSMKGGQVPCDVIGSYDGEDVNFASSYLSTIVKKFGLPPKVLIVHRFTKGMLTNFRKIKTRPEVQVVIDMDGFGFPAKKVSSYEIAVTSEPVQFAGFKLFYKNDKLNSPYRLMDKREILSLYPSPIYIQYQ